MHETYNIKFIFVFQILLPKGNHTCKAEVVPAIPLRVRHLSELFLLTKADRRLSCVAEYHIKHYVVLKASSNVVLKT